MPRKRAFPDELKAPSKIKPVRAPRMGDVELPAGGKEMIAALDKFRKAVLANSDHATVAMALGELRAHLNFVRDRWSLNATLAKNVHDKTSDELYAKHNLKKPEFTVTTTVRPDIEAAISTGQLIRAMTLREVARRRR